MNEIELNRAVDELLAAYRGGSLMEDLPAACRPGSVSEARQIQDRLVARLGGHGGWKVAPIQPGVEPGCAPIPRERVLHSPARWPVPGTAVLELEVEVAVSFAHDLDGTNPIGQDEVRAAIAGLHPALEIVASRFRDRASLPVFTTTADLQNNGGLVAGPATTGWQTLELDRLAIELLFDGRQVAKADSGAHQDSMLASLTWLANHARTRGKPLRRGQIVLTGARIKPTPVERGVLVHARVNGLGTVELAT